MKIMTILNRLVLGAAILAVLSFPQPLSAATRIWSPPGANRQWTQATNWAGGVAPVAGDTLVFATPPGLSFTTNNFPVDTTFDRLIFGENASPEGNRIRLTGGLLSTNDETVNFNLPVQLANAVTFEQGVPSIGSFFIMNDVALGTNTLTCHTPIDSVAGIALGGSFLSPPVVLSGSGALRKTGPGRLELAVVSTNFTGPVVVEQGEIILKLASSLGVTNVPTEVRPGAALYVDGGGTSYEQVLLGGTLGCFGSGGVWAGPITLTNGGGALASRFVLCRVEGPIRGTGTLRLRNLTAGHSVTFMGGASNTFSGDTILETNYTASANRTAGTTVIPGNLVLEANSDFGVFANDQIADTASVTVGPGARLNVGSRRETIQRLVLNSSRAQVLNGALGVRDRVDTGTNGTSWIGLASDEPTDGHFWLLSSTNVILNVSNAAAATDFYLGVATISTNGVGLWKTGSGRLVLGSSSNAISGITRIVEGELFVNGISTNEHQLAGGTLGGTGAVGRITAAAAGGTVAPGESAGRLLSSNVVWNSAVTFAVEINGTNAGVNYDQLGVRGTVNLGGAALNLTNTITPPLGTAFLILTNDGADAITGTFAGLTNGARLTNNFVGFAISYTAGDGNDIALIATNYTSPPAVRTWSGGGGNGSWTNAANWVGGVAPNPGDTLVFPGPGATSTNDFPAGTTFGALRVTGGAWTFRGSAFTLSDGLVVSNATGAITFSNAVTLTGGGITNLATPALVFAGAVDGGTATLPIHAGGPIEMNSTLAGLNGFLKVATASLTLAGTNTGLLGTNRLDAGTLIVSGSTTNVTELNGGTLAGTGAVGWLISQAGGGIVSPGGGSPGLLSTRSNVIWNAATTFTVQLNNTNAGAGYDQLGVRGTVNLGGATLNLTNTFTPPLGTAFLVLTNDGVDAITGTFAGLTNGARLTNNFVAFVVSYTAGDGNDIGLIVTNYAFPPAVRTWSGGGGNGSWTNAANWVGGVPPNPGDTLVFPGPGATSTNDFPAGTTFGALRVTGGAWNFAGAAFTLSDGLVVSNATGAITFSNAVTLTGGGITNLAAPALVFASAVDAGTNNLPIHAGGPIEMNSTLAGLNGFLKVATASLTLAGTNTGLLGTNRLDAGTLVVTGTTTNRTELNGGTLSGTGTVGALTSLAGGGFVSPAGGSAGLLSTRGNVVWNGATTLSLQLNGTNVVTEYDQLGVRGTVNLGGAALNLTVTLSPPSNTVFLVLTNDGADAITGTFAGLPEGATFTNSGTVFRISYVGGTGNDVTLTSLGPPPTPGVVVRVWDGDQGLPQWSWPNNWDGNTLPAPGNALLFTGGSQTSNTNDLTAGLAYHSLRLYGNSWDLSGNAVTLHSGLVLTSFTAASTVRLPLTLATNQGFTNLPATGFSGARLTLGGPIALDTNTLTFFAAAPIEVTNQIFGSGGLVKLGTKELSLNVSNSFTGPVSLTEGTVYIRNARSLGGTESNTHVASNATLHIVGAINSPENVFLGGTLSSSNGNGRISGTLTLTNGARFNITGTAQITIGPTAGTADVEKTGSGTLLLTGNTHSHTGAVRVAAGRVQANGTSRGTTFCTTASPTNAVLSGVGTLGHVILTNTSGQVAITPGPTTGGPESLIISNLLNTFPSNRLVVELNGTNAATPDFDILDVRGTVALGGMQLQLVPGFTPPVGAKFVVLINDGTDPIGGTFAGLPQDATFTVSNVTFQISYTGGTGNDVELSILPTGFPSALTSITSLTNSLLRLTATGTPAQAYALVAATNLNTPILWSPVVTNLADGAGLIEFILPDRTNHPARFYRLRSP